MMTWINLNEEEKQLVLDGKLVICEPDMEPDAEQPNKAGNKPRTIISPFHLSVLQDSFAKNCHPSRRDKNALAKQLDLPWYTVDYWFNNARKKKNK